MILTQRKLTGGGKAKIQQTDLTPYEHKIMAFLGDDACGMNVTYDIGSSDEESQSSSAAPYVNLFYFLINIYPNV